MLIDVGWGQHATGRVQDPIDVFGIDATLARRDRAFTDELQAEVDRHQLLGVVGLAVRRERRAFEEVMHLMVRNLQYQLRRLLRAATPSETVASR